MEDRLKDLQRIANAGGLAVYDRDDMKETDRGESFMPDFMSRTRDVQSYLEAIRSNNQEMLNLKERHRACTLPEQEKRISQQLKQLIDANGETCTAAKDVLEFISEEVEQAKKIAPGEPETRMKINTHTALMTKFRELLKETQTVQIDTKSSIKQKIVRQARLIDENLTDRQIEEICQDPEGASRLVASKMFGQGHTRLQNAVSDIQDKYRDIQRLEASVAVVHQMFVDLALLVHAQGEALDNIELNIDQAHNYVNKGERKLQEAKEYHQSSRKKLCCLAVIGIIVLVAIVVPIASYARAVSYTHLTLPTIYSV
eukprot:TRINITY_DN15615_c0_g1_i2.p1 TRINITY_DN15615_c0_g1~~TRINITY_DN15615_c0_g1_i2.p1  ORF type:complete len:314 (+),score=82.63 TRINITY_DN15615_c0_g1_i2:80-1021(+)